MTSMQSAWTSRLFVPPNAHCERWRGMLSSCVWVLCCVSWVVCCHQSHLWHGCSKLLVTVWEREILRTSVEFFMACQLCCLLHFLSCKRFQKRHRIVTEKEMVKQCPSREKKKLLDDFGFARSLQLLCLFLHETFETWPHWDFPLMFWVQALLDDAQRQIQNQEKLFQRMTKSLQDKDQQLQALLQNQQVRALIIKSWDVLLLSDLTSTWVKNSVNCFMWRKQAAKFSIVNHICAEKRLMLLSLTAVHRSTWQHHQATQRTVKREGKSSGGETDTKKLTFKHNNIFYKSCLWD